MADRKIRLSGEDGDIELYVVEQTMIGNVNYLLVTASDDDEAQAYIMKETGTETEDAFYTFVEDENELEAISKVFGELLEDVDLEIDG